MSERVKTLLIWGIPLEESDAAKLNAFYLQHPEYQNPDEETLSLVPSARQLQRVPYSFETPQEGIPISKDLGHGNTGGIVLDSIFATDGANACYEDTQFEPGLDHYVGILVGSKGLNGDKLNKLIKTTQVLADANFKDFVAPKLTELGIHLTTPEFHYINQTV